MNAEERTLLRRLRLQIKENRRLVVLESWSDKRKSRDRCDDDDCGEESNGWWVVQTVQIKCSDERWVAAEGLIGDKPRGLDHQLSQWTAGGLGVNGVESWFASLTFKGTPSSVTVGCCEGFRASSTLWAAGHGFGPLRSSHPCLRACRLAQPGSIQPRSGSAWRSSGPPPARLPSRDRRQREFSCFRVVPDISFAARGRIRC